MNITAFDRLKMLRTIHNNFKLNIRQLNKAYNCDFLRIDSCDFLAMLECMRIDGIKQIESEVA